MRWKSPLGKLIRMIPLGYQLALIESTAIKELRWKEPRKETRQSLQNCATPYCLKDDFLVAY